MARTGGRSTPIAIFVGLVCLAILAVLVLLVGPAVPVVGDWLSTLFGNALAALNFTSGT